VLLNNTDNDEAITKQIYTLTLCCAAEHQYVETELSVGPFVWPDTTQPINWVTQTRPNSSQIEKCGPNPTQPSATNNWAYSLKIKSLSKNCHRPRTNLRRLLLCCRACSWCIALHHASPSVRPSVCLSHVTAYKTIFLKNDRVQAARSHTRTYRECRFSGQSTVLVWQ